jgi:hypothetical protein
LVFFAYRGKVPKIFHDDENDPKRLFRFRKAYIKEILDRVDILINKNKVFQNIPV